MKRPFVCTKATCAKSYTTRFSLRRHMTSHLQVKQHICVICFKSFTLSQYLKEHTYIHTGQKPFQCDFPGCSRAFRQAGKLSLHKKIHSNIVFSIQKCKRTKPTDTCQPFSCMTASSVGDLSCTEDSQDVKSYYKSYSQITYPRVEAETSGELPASLTKESGEDDVHPRSLGLTSPACLLMKNIKKSKKKVLRV